MYGRFQDIAALIGRLGIAAVFLAYGIPKWMEGHSATAQMFGEELGVPLPAVAAGFVMVVEVIGSILFIIGLLMPVIGICFAIIGVGAIVFVNFEMGLMEGYDLDLALAAAALAIGFNGGRFSLDYAMFGRRRARRTAAPAAETPANA